MGTGKPAQLERGLFRGHWCHGCFSLFANGFYVRSSSVRISYRSDAPKFETSASRGSLRFKRCAGMDYGPGRDNAAGRGESAILGIDLRRLLIGLFYVVVRVRYLRVRGIANRVPGKTRNALQRARDHGVAPLAHAPQPFELVVIGGIVESEVIGGHDCIGCGAPYFRSASRVGNTRCIELK